jgi:hypothetical protein
LTRRWLAVAAVALVAIAACTRSATSTPSPAALYAGAPTQSDIRSLFHDDNWWEGPPTFDVLPLNSATASATQVYALEQQFAHIGTQEQLFIRYTIYASTSSATSFMTDVSTANPNAPTSPKVGDSVIYNVQQGSGGTPIITITFVRLGQTVVAIEWSMKDTAMLNLTDLSRTANLVVQHLKNVQAGKVHPTPQAINPKELPPPSLELTLLGSARMPVEAWAVMTRTGIPQTFFDLVHQDGITSFTYGDYALNNDTAMEVQTALLDFQSPADAQTWASSFAPGQPDQAGIASAYLPVGGTPAAGEYEYLFVAGNYGGMLVCKPSVDGTAATRDCEGPMEATALAWGLALSG